MLTRYQCRGGCRASFALWDEPQVKDIIPLGVRYEDLNSTLTILIEYFCIGYNIPLKYLNNLVGRRH